MIPRVQEWDWWWSILRGKAVCASQKHVWHNGVCCGLQKLLTHGRCPPDWLTTLPAMLSTSLSRASGDLAGALLPGLALPSAFAGVGCRLAGRDLASLWESCAADPFTGVAVLG